LVRLEEIIFHLKAPLTKAFFPSASRLAPQQDQTSKLVYQCYQLRMFVNRLVTNTNLRKKLSKILAFKELKISLFTSASRGGGGGLQATNLKNFSLNFFRWPKRDVASLNQRQSLVVLDI